MMPQSTITIALDRAFDSIDDKAIRRLVAEWLVYDVKVQRNNSSAKIQLFHSNGAKPHLLRELGEIYSAENIIDN